MLDAFERKTAPRVAMRGPHLQLQVFPTICYKCDREILQLLPRCMCWTRALLVRGCAVRPSTIRRLRQFRRRWYRACDSRGSHALHHQPGRARLAGFTGQEEIAAADSG